MRKYYLDTNIWRDYFENREDKFRPLGKWAFQLIKKIVEEENTLLYSDIIIKELKICYNLKQIDSIFSIAKEILFKINIDYNQAKEARTLSNKLNIPFGDALYAILARDSGALLITRDKHFNLLKDIVEIKKPEDLL